MNQGQFRGSSVEAVWGNNENNASLARIGLGLGASGSTNQARLCAWGLKGSGIKGEISTTPRGKEISTTNGGPYK